MRRIYYIYGLWLIGAIIWLYFGEVVLNYYEKNRNMTFNSNPYIMASSLVNFIDGLYFGSLIMIGRRSSFNKPLLLAVTLPAILLSLLGAFQLVIVLPGLDLLYDNSSYLLKISGFSLVLAFYTGKVNPT
ncbi:hypothetical protein ACFO9Q_10485 [Paenibacillus sp. GCM10023252]|uniref:hypothetical protein n=1 Tax=Paenibacillus sp. GCM10023252 TaxID=3252649 RepID=UPI0036136E5B